MLVSIRVFNFDSSPGWWVLLVLWSGFVHDKVYLVQLCVMNLWQVDGFSGYSVFGFVHGTPNLLEITEMLLKVNLFCLSAIFLYLSQANTWISYDLLICDIITTWFNV
jgi:hypothetical protein